MVKVSRQNYFMQNKSKAYISKNKCFRKIMRRNYPILLY